MGLSRSTPATAPASVTSSPSRIQVMPSATTTSQWKRPQGRRSSRAGTSVATSPRRRAAASSGGDVVGSVDTFQRRAGPWPRSRDRETDAPNDIVSTLLLPHSLPPPPPDSRQDTQRQPHGSAKQPPAQDRPSQ